MGIGPGNWYQTIGHYLPEYEGKDSHNTYVKCAVELGVFGISFFLLLLWQAYRNVKKVHDEVYGPGRPMCLRILVTFTLPS